MVKIHISGASSSGKTTLAEEVASRFHCPHYDLDKLNWEQESTLTIAEQDAWVTEGIYLVLTEPMLYYADYIVLLEISWPRAAWRMVRRHVLNSLRRNNPYPGIRGLVALYKLLKYTRRYILNLDGLDVASTLAVQAYIETHHEFPIQLTEDFLKSFFETYRQFFIPPSEDFVRKYLTVYKEKLFIIRNDADRKRMFALLAQK